MTLSQLHAWAQPNVKLGLSVDGRDLVFSLLPDDDFEGNVANTVVTVRWETAPGVSVASPNSVLPINMDWWLPVGAVTYAGTSTDGIYSYASWYTFSVNVLGPSKKWPANLEQSFFRVPYTNTSGACVEFEVVTDAYQTAHNLGWYISLNGQDKTDGYIPGKESAQAYSTPLCQAGTVQLDASGEVVLAASDLDAGAGSYCGVDSTVLSPASLGCSDVDVARPVQLKVYYTNGGIATCTAMVTALQVDSDGDGVLDCADGCPTDPLKTAPGLCGCGNPDMDLNNNNVCDDDEVPSGVKLGLSVEGGDLVFSLLPDGDFEGNVAGTVVTVRWETAPGVSVASP
ncbi:MAG TPA: hypothetical protein PKD45_05165, partial [Flavobacteriales bacterium]|nr:hypothetical protein [Flavobacteriales bacterium]